MESMFFDSVIEQPNMQTAINESSILESSKNIPALCSTPIVNIEQNLINSKRKLLIENDIAIKMPKFEEQKENSSTSDESLEVTVVEKTKTNISVLKEIEKQECEIKYSTADVLSIEVVEDDFLLISSDEDKEEDKNYESYCHLLDSPKVNKNESTLKNDKLDDDSGTLKESKDSSSFPNALLQDKTDAHRSALVATKKSSTSPNVLSGKPEADLANVDASEKCSWSLITLSDHDLNKSKQKSRSQILKPFIETYTEPKPYPSWLQKAKENCSSQELECLMKTVYATSNNVNKKGSSLGDLTLKNYRKALRYVGLNPDKLPSNVNSSNFYSTEPSKEYKRFVLR